MSKNAAPIIVDQRKEALEYIEKHNINKLFEILGSELAQHKPDDPNNFLLLRLQKFKDMKTKDDPVTLFTEKDIDVMFSIFDLTGRGYVTPSQYMKGETFCEVELHVTQVLKIYCLCFDSFVSCGSG